MGCALVVFLLGSLDKFIDFGPETKYVLMESPSKEEAAEFVRGNWRRFVIVIFAFSRVIYRGRAESKLSWDDHLIILKPDGTLLVHGPAKREPINWQPPGSILTSFVENGKLIIRSRRDRPREIVIIEVDEIYVLLAVNTKKGLFRIFRTESQMVDYVLRNPGFIEEGFIPVSREYQFGYGIIDLLGRDRDGNVVICEFKRRIADIQDVAQLALYVEMFPRTKGIRIRGILVAPDITERALQALREKGLEFRRLDPKTIENWMEKRRQR